MLLLGSSCILCALIVLLFHDRSIAKAVCDENCAEENDLKEMVAYVGGRNVAFRAYVTPPLESFYRTADGQKPTKEKKKVTNAVNIKFFNLSPDTVWVYWDPKSREKEPVFSFELKPFQSTGTTSYAGHTMLFKPKDDPSQVLMIFHVKVNTCVCVYDPLKDLDQEQLQARLSESDLRIYDLHCTNQEFAEQYRKVTGREWLALYPLTKPPSYPMWSAKYFGQEHNASTTVTHFVKPVPKHLAFKRVWNYANVPDLDEYRAPQKTFNMTLKVLSVAPRVFEVKNFLSDIEVDHILQIASAGHLQRSETGTGIRAAKSAEYRTSTNTWVDRRRSPIVNEIHKRAADLMGIDEAYLRTRSPEELPELEHKRSNAEMLQLVHYGLTQEYRPHHDFMFPSIKSKCQSSRFMTLLLYLNDDMKGGETAFPSWLNGHTTKPLEVVPEKGKAVLFYNVLPDGNFDDRSLHASLPVKNGEKYLINLWTWSDQKILRNEKLEWLENYGIHPLDWAESLTFASGVLSDYGIDVQGALYRIQKLFT